MTETSIAQINDRIAHLRLVYGDADQDAALLEALLKEREEAKEGWHVVMPNLDQIGLAPAANGGIDTSAEAVEGLAKRIHASCGCAFGANAEQPVAGTLRALLAELDALKAEVERLKAQPAQSVKVKPLVWNADNEARPSGCFYAIWGDYRSFKISCNGVVLGGVLYGAYQQTYHTVDAAKAAAQADYETRIMAALDVQPLTVQDAARVLLTAREQGQIDVEAVKLFLKGQPAAALRAIAEGRE